MQALMQTDCVCTGRWPEHLPLDRFVQRAHLTVFDHSSSITSCSASNIAVQPPVPPTWAPPPAALVVAASSTSLHQPQPISLYRGPAPIPPQQPPGSSAPSGRTASASIHRKAKKSHPRFGFPPVTDRGFDSMSTGSAPQNEEQQFQVALWPETVRGSLYFPSWH